MYEYYNTVCNIQVQEIGVEVKLSGSKIPSHHSNCSDSCASRLNRLIQIRVNKMLLLGCIQNDFAPCLVYIFFRLVFFQLYIIICESWSSYRKHLFYFTLHGKHLPYSTYLDNIFFFLLTT